MIISILGCGWYGKALAKSLIKSGFNIKGSATSEGKLQQLSDDGVAPYLVKFNPDSETYDRGFFVCDVLIISIPPRVRYGEGPDYLYKLKRIIDTVKSFQITKVMYISSTGVYADNYMEVDESTMPEPDTETGKMLVEAEKIFQNETSFKTTILRFAGLVGPGRHPGRFFAGKKNIPNGLAPVNLIHLDDCVGIGTAIIKREAFGFLINACSPDHPTKSEFYTKASAQAGLEIPEFINELTSWKIVNSTILTDLLDYRFKFTVWNEWNFKD